MLLFILNFFILLILMHFRCWSFIYFFCKPLLLFLGWKSLFTCYVLVKIENFSVHCHVGCFLWGFQKEIKEEKENKNKMVYHDDDKECLWEGLEGVDVWNYNCWFLSWNVVVWSSSRIFLFLLNGTLLTSVSFYFFIYLFHFNQLYTYAFGSANNSIRSGCQCGLNRDRLYKTCAEIIIVCEKRHWKKRKWVGVEGKKEKRKKSI